jgi:ATP-dependent protease ClpP protease subunit
MPVKSCKLNGKSGYKFGDSGKCYTYTKEDKESKNRAYKKAVKQGQAEHSNFKYIQNYLNGYLGKESVGTIRIDGVIGDVKDQNGNITPGIKGAMFAYEMDYLQNNFERINVIINSTGGSIIEGYAIFNSIISCKVPVDIYIIGMCASMAGVIAMAGDCIYMYDYALLMMHNPSGDKADKGLLDLFKSTLIIMISKRTGKSPEEIDNLMNDTTWLKADEAKELGLIDIIIETDEKDEVMEELEEFEMNNSELNLMDIYNVFNKKINKPEMEKNRKEDLSILDKIKAMLNKAKDDDMDDDNDEEMMDSLKNEIKNLKKANKDMSDKLDSYDKKAKESKEKEIKDLVNSYIETNVIKEEEIESITNLMMVDMNSTKKLLEKSKNIVGEPTRITNKLINNSIPSNGEDRTNWTILDWAKKDHKGLDEMRISNSILYQELVNKSNSKFKI